MRAYCACTGVKTTVEKMRLDELKIGQKGTVLFVAGIGQLKKRILDLGITKGAPVKMIRKAPLGDPVEIEVRGYRLTLRRAECDFVEVEADAEGASE